MCCFLCPQPHQSLAPTDASDHCIGHDKGNSEGSSHSPHPTLCDVTPQFAHFPFTRHQFMLQPYVRTGGQVTRLLFPRHNVPKVCRLLEARASILSTKASLTQVCISTVIGWAILRSGSCDVLSTTDRGSRMVSPQADSGTMDRRGELNEEFRTHRLQWLHAACTSGAGTPCRK